MGILCACLVLAGCDAGGGDPFATAPAGPSQAATSAPQPETEVASIAPPQLTKFQNMRASDVEALVGEPDFRRVEPPAELWQYRSAECVVDLFLYGQGDTMHVTHEDARGRDPARADNDRCGDGSQVMKKHLRDG